ncbi:helix-turn-helix domain-containing protein [Agrobacterium tumefaciens]|uniref:HTH cro/C1-type domain-containing protein n=1 Tax=Agrobacterium tumefaciens TaxID=358 RepID=A0A176X2Y9_AGRTU|nr:helix-turn-helix domain-containing protein [Agrobacterium tumefaciens]OAE40690.1 hypothetical protein A7J57_10555 [Agrobacterium tumefaciens]
MIVITGKTRASKSKLVIRHKEFAKRLSIACENSRQARISHGRQIWLKNKLESQFNEVVSREAVRKWFSGESKPKPALMSLVARALGVDEAWLAIGSPNITVSEKRLRNVLATGATNMVAAQIQLSGGTVGFPEDERSGVDLFAIIKGRHKTVAARYGNENGSFKVDFPLHVDTAIVVMPTDVPTVYRFFSVPREVISEDGNIRGEYIEINCEFVADRLVVGSREVPEIVSFNDLNGVTQSQKTRPYRLADIA